MIDAPGAPSADQDWATLDAALQPKYTVVKRLGQGGMGSVYLANEVALGRMVAVKVLAPALAYSEDSRLRFEREARAAAGISHPNVVQVYTVGEIPGDPPLPYIIMQHVDGVGLDVLLREQGRLRERHARRILRDVAAGLDAAHQRDLVHRDIKPANILIESATGRARIADFGISAALSPRAIGGAQPMSEAGVVLGTLPYMSPEQTLGDQVDVQSDVYSLGVVAYEILSGALPYDVRSPAEWMLAHLAWEPTPLRERRRGISDGLVRLVERCLIKEAGTRPSAADLSRALVPSADDEIPWPPPGLSRLPGAGRHLRRTAVLLAAAAAGLSAALAVRVPGVHTAAGWWEAWAGGGVILTNPAAAPSTWSVVLWEVTLVSTALALAAALAAFAWQLVGSARALRAHRLRGWRCETLFDALTDPDGRTGLLLSGAGEFATTTSADRDRIRSFRRVTHTAILAGAGWVAFAFGVWTVSGSLGAPLLAPGGPPMRGVPLLFLFVPPAIALIVAGRAAVRERRLGGPEWRRPHSGTFAVPSVAEGDDIAAWYADIVGDPGPDAPPRPASPSRIAMSQVGIAALSAWTILALAALVTASLFAGRLSRRLGPDTARVAELIETEASGRPLRELRSLLMEYLPTAPATTEDGASSLVALVDASAQALPNYPVEPRRALGSQNPELTSVALVAEAVRRAAVIPIDTLTLLNALAEHPRTRALRVAAAARGVTIPIDADSAFAIRTAMEANAAGAVVRAARRDFVGARARLAENAAIAEVALATPSRHWSETGLRMLHSLVVLPLAELERLRGDLSSEARLRQGAASIAETIDRFGASWTIGAIGLASDPRDLRILLRLSADSTVPIGFRRGAIDGASDAVCLNPREWLMGADSARRAVLRHGPAPPVDFRARGLRAVIGRMRYCARLS